MFDLTKYSYLVENNQKRLMERCARYAFRNPISLGEALEFKACALINIQIFDRPDMQELKDDPSVIRAKKMWEDKLQTIEGMIKKFQSIQMAEILNSWSIVERARAISRIVYGPYHPVPNR